MGEQGITTLYNKEANGEVEKEGIINWQREKEEEDRRMGVLVALWRNYQHRKEKRKNCQNNW